MSRQLDAERLGDTAPDLSGQIALVTGGGGGLGRVTAELLARSGARVAIVGRTPGKVHAAVNGILATGGQATGFNVDVTDPAGVASAVTAIEETFGPPDLLVNNAARMTPIGEHWEEDPTEWWRTFEVNIRGAYICTRAVLPSMLARRHGCVINIATGAVNRACAQGSAYAASKAALVHWATSLAAGVAAHGIRVFAVDPGLMSGTGMSDFMTRSERCARYLAGVRQRLDQGQGSPPERAARLVALLAAGGPCDVLSGRLISVYDDLPDLVDRADEIQRADLYTLRTRRS